MTASKGNKADLQKDRIPRLTPQEIRSLCCNLSAPVSVWTNGTASFEVYKAKSLYNEEWLNQTLYKLVLDARSSYDRWGGDLFFPDVDDSKAVVYLVRASYPLMLEGHSEGCEVEEWFTFRFIPGNGEPFGIRDLSLFTCDGKPIIDVIQEVLFKGEGACLDFLANSSRLGSIAPYFRLKEDEDRYSVKLPGKHRYTAVSLGLMNRQFLQEVYEARIPFRYIVGIIRDELIVKALSVRFNGICYAPAFTPAFEALGLQNDQAIKLDRHAFSMQAYQFPSYFFEVDQLIAALRSAIEAGSLSDETIKYYFQTERTFGEITEKDMFTTKDLRSLGKLLTTKGRIKESGMTGEQLRIIIDREVGDGPGLKITTVEARTRSISDLFHAAQLVRVK